MSMSFNTDNNINMNKNINKNLDKNQSMNNDLLFFKKKGKIENKTEFFISNILLNDDSNKENDIKYSNIDIMKKETMNKIALRKNSKSKTLKSKYIDRDNYKDKSTDKDILKDKYIDNQNINNKHILNNKKDININIGKKGKYRFFNK
jgi:hypothetical protein